MMINSFAKNWLGWLSTVHACLKPDEHLYLLLDGAFIPGFHRILRASLPRQYELALLFEAQSNCTEEARDVSPIVIPYAADNARLEDALQRCNGLPMISAITTSENLDELTQRLAAWCIVKADDQSFNFRFPDTRRLPGIFSVLTLDQRAELVGPASTWHYIARDGRWAALPMPCLNCPVSEYPKLDATQFTAMVDDSKTDEILLLLKDRGRQWNPLPHSQMYELARTALRMADQALLNPDRHLDWCEAYIDEAFLTGDAPAFAHLLAWQNQLQA
jgi:hypothetical protein